MPANTLKTNATLPIVEPRATAFDVVIAVWGPAFTRVFLDVCVPNQLTPGNIGALPPGSRYRVFTSREDVPTLEASSALQRVNETIPVDIVVMRELSSESRNRFNRLTACHRRALTEAADSNAGLIFLMADHLISEGAFAAALRRHAGGSRAIMCSGIRVNREEFVTSLESRGGVSAVPPRELVAAAIPNLHSFTRKHMIDSGSTPVLPIGVCWPVGDEGIVARFCYLHPLLVDPQRREVLPEGTLDEHYIRRTCPIRDEVHVADDSDELVIFEMSHAEASFTETHARPTSRWRAAQMISRCDTHQQSYWMQPIRIHAGDIGPDWNTVEEQSARFADHSMKLWEASRWLTSRYLKVQARRLAKRYSQRRMRRSLDLLTHGMARRIHKFRKQATRAGRRVLVR